MEETRLGTCVDAKDALVVICCDVHAGTTLITQTEDDPMPWSFFLTPADGAIFGRFGTSVVVCEAERISRSGGYKICACCDLSQCLFWCCTDHPDSQ